MFGHKVCYGLVQHLLLVLVEIDPKLLERDNRGVLRIVISADVLLSDAAGLHDFRSGFCTGFRRGQRCGFGCDGGFLADGRQY